MRILCRDSGPSIPPAAQAKFAQGNFCGNLPLRSFISVQRQEREHNMFIGNNFVYRVFIIYFHYGEASYVEHPSMHNEMLILVYLAMLRYLRSNHLL